MNESSGRFSLSGFQPVFCRERSKRGKRAAQPFLRHAIGKAGIPRTGKIIARHKQKIVCHRLFAKCPRIVFR